ncbi:MAG TPA: hydroxyisourate hydrolase [Thermoanaerobaculia bacterium]|nr:hydroxyisourate hydrolase [Thermoanaerobaculia bacterium]
MSGITTHVLDTAHGRPAAGVRARLERRGQTTWELIGSGQTDADGRLRNLLATPLESGTFRITFDTASYFAAMDLETFYPEASIVFTVVDPSQHYHVPLLLSPFGYSTYRGS